MSEALAAWNGYVFDRPRSPRWEGVYPGPEMALRRLLWARHGLSWPRRRPCQGGHSAAFRGAVSFSPTPGNGSRRPAP